MRACQHPWSLSARHSINHRRVTLVSSEQRKDSCWMPSDVIWAASSCSQRGSNVGDVNVEVDGADAERNVLVECWAQQGIVKPAQKHKVLGDALKLTWVASQLPLRPRLILCLSDLVAAAPFTTAQSWAAAAFRDLGIEVHVVTLDDETRQRVQNAQSRQYR
jgi:hypothetical protein